MSHPPTNSEIRALLRRDFPSFLRKVFETLHPGEAYLHNWHIEAMIWLLEQAMLGDTRRVMINVPPRTLKSMIFSVAWPAFILGQDPTRSIFCVSLSLDLAAEHHANFRKIVESDWYKMAFTTMAPAASKETELIYRTSQGGQRKAFSVDSKITGQGAHYTIIDDPQDASDALSEQTMEKINRWITEVLMGRFNKGAEAVLALVQQRLALNDASAHLLEIEPWSHLSLPALADRDIEVPIGPDRSHLFQRGDLLHPELLPASYLESRRKAMGAAAYSAQYLQAPSPAGGGYIDVSLFRRYRRLPKTWDTTFLSIDAASGSDSGSYSVIQHWMISDGRIYLAGSWRGRWTFPELRKWAIGLQAKLAADFFLIEYAASGQALAQELWSHYPREVAVKMVQKFKPKHSKEVRMDLAMVPIEGGRVYLPEDADWLEQLISELRAFPNGANGDQVDALSQALWFFSQKYEHNMHNPAHQARSRVIASW